MDSVEPGRLIRQALGRRGDALWVRSVLSAARREFVFVPSRVALLAVGKAAVPMARAVHEALGSRVDTGLVISPSNAPSTGLPPSWRLVLSGHPQPDAGSLEAGSLALRLAASLGKDDLLLVLLSGGGSALMAAPAEGITLEEKSRTVALLTAAGALIVEINAVRGALSRVKAGWLSSTAAAADIVTLVLSDLGDDGWHHVASGPTLGMPPTGAAALAILERYRLTPLVSPSVRAFLSRALPPQPRPTGNRWSVLLADIRTAMEGARLTALRLGVEARVVPELLAGEARSAARRLAVCRRVGRAAPATRRRPPPSDGHDLRRRDDRDGEGDRGMAAGTANSPSPPPGRSRASRAPVRSWPAPTASTTKPMRRERSWTARRSRAPKPGVSTRRSRSSRTTAGPFSHSSETISRPGPTGTNVGDVAFVLSPGEDAVPDAV